MNQIYASTITLVFFQLLTICFPFMYTAKFISELSDPLTDLKKVEL